MADSGCDRVNRMDILQAAVSHDVGHQWNVPIEFPDRGRASCGTADRKSRTRIWEDGDGSRA